MYLQGSTKIASKCFISRGLCHCDSATTKKGNKNSDFSERACIPGKGKGYELAGGGEDDACVEGADDVWFFTSTTTTITIITTTTDRQTMRKIFF